METGGGKEFVSIKSLIIFSLPVSLQVISNLVPATDFSSFYSAKITK
jgi:hypothetical protein